MAEATAIQTLPALLDAVAARYRPANEVSSAARRRATCQAP
jgi:hypothetical protein